MTTASVAIRVARKPSRASFASFVMLVAALLGGGMIGLLVLSTALQDQAFTVNAKRAEATALANRISGLEAEVASANSMTSLASKAQAIGMKPNPYAAQLLLPSGEVVGDPKPVLGGEVPAAKYQTLDEQKAERERLEAEAQAKKEAEKAKRLAEEEARKAAAAAAAAEQGGQ
ncbi:MAG: hypothetical protein LBR58_07720 [Propionibacteriaceae bacterium]|jgi:hypothetical protein|nr:hypothetical protein [Propionibacteriaceae bacterium]